MNLTTQLATQEAMLLRLYPGKTLDEIYSKEHDSFVEYMSGYGEQYLFKKYTEEYILIPPTLPRVLDALSDGYFYHLGFICHTQDIFTPNVVIVRDAKRKLRNEDGTDATLWDQSQETQDSIGELMK